MFEINNRKHVEYIIKDMFGEKEFTFTDNDVDIMVDFGEDIHCISKEAIQIEMDNYNIIKEKYSKNKAMNKLCIITDKDFLYDTYDLIKKLNEIGYSVDILHNGNFYHIKEEFKDINVKIYDMLDFNGNTFIQDYIDETGNSNFLIYNDSILGKLSGMNINRFYTLYFSTMKNIEYVQKICINFNKEKDVMVTNYNKIYEYFKNDIGNINCIFFNTLSDNIYQGNKMILIPITSSENFDLELMIKTISPIGIPCLILANSNVDISDIKNKLDDNFIRYNIVKYNDKYVDMLNIVVKLYSDFFKIVVSYDKNGIPKYLENIINKYDSITLSKIDSSKNTVIEECSIINIIKNIIKKYGNPFDNNIETFEYSEDYILEAKELIDR